VDAEHDVIHFALSKRKIVMYQGFPMSLDPLQDKVGRGTHGVSVLMRTAPNAALYIARVSDAESMRSNQDQSTTVKVCNFLIVSLTDRQYNGPLNVE